MYWPAFRLVSSWLTFGLTNLKVGHYSWLVRSRRLQKFARCELALGVMLDPVQGRFA
jgi:hypothetical protein